MRRSETYEIILNTVATLFAKWGYHTSLQSIADACDIKKASIYYHFKGRDEIIAAMILEKSVQRKKFFEKTLEATDIKKAFLEYVSKLLEPEQLLLMTRLAFEVPLESKILRPLIAEYFLEFETSLLTVLELFLDKKEAKRRRKEMMDSIYSAILISRCVGKTFVPSAVLKIIPSLLMA